MKDGPTQDFPFAEFRLAEPHVERPIRFMELWDVSGWRLKVYGIAYREERPAAPLIARAKQLAAQELAQIDRSEICYGLGYLGIHSARERPLAFLDFWANENEIRHFAYTAPASRPDLLHRAQRDQISYCIWDMAVADFERRAWIETMLKNPEGPDMEAYLERRLDTRI